MLLLDLKFTIRQQHPSHSHLPLIPAPPPLHVYLIPVNVETFQAELVSHGFSVVLSLYGEPASSGRSDQSLPFLLPPFSKTSSWCAHKNAWVVKLRGGTEHSIFQLPSSLNIFFLLGQRAWGGTDIHFLLRWVELSVGVLTKPRLLFSRLESKAWD